MKDDNEMPTGEMGGEDRTNDMPGSDAEADNSGEMPKGRMIDEQRDEVGDMPSGKMEGAVQRVIIELRIPEDQDSMEGLNIAQQMDVSAFQLDNEYTPIEISPSPNQAAQLDREGEKIVIIRGEIDSAKIPELEAQDEVLSVRPDTELQPFRREELRTRAQNSIAIGEEDVPVIQYSEESDAAIDETLGSCPIPPCDCDPGTAKGTIKDVAQYLGVDRVHNEGYQGEGIVVGVVDGGITAQNRVSGGKIPQVTDGWPSDNWGTKDLWDGHGNMCATDVLGMAPAADIYDIRIADGGAALSNALAGYQWAINQYRANGTPHVLSNSFGIYQESWDKDYARNANHPLTRKVVEAIDEGIIVLFAAGNCGGGCNWADRRCGSDNGPGRSIWGSNGHPRVMTVGAVNVQEEFVGYSSRGPAALDPQKPDFCSITHFRGYTNSDAGTSAACPIAAGVTALLKQADPSLTPDQAKGALKQTAKDIGPSEFDQHSGSGIIQGKAAYDTISKAQWSEWESLGGTCLHGVGASSWADHRLDLFVAGVDSAMYHKWWDGSAWSDWENLGGTIIAEPAAVSWGADRIDTFVIGVDNALYHKWWDGSAWSNWESQGGKCIYGPAVSSWAENRLDVFTIGVDNALYHKWWDGSAWSDWESLGGTIIAEPAAVSWGADRIDTFVIGVDNALYHKWWDGSAWSNWENMGGVCIQGTAASSQAENSLDVFVIGTDNQLYQKSWNGSAWSGWTGLGGTSISAPEAVSWGRGRIDAFVLGTDSALYHKWYGRS